MQVDGRRRWWLEHESAVAVSTRPAALVLVLHGGGGSPEGAERMTAMSELSDEEGFLVLYPAGTGVFPRRLLTWNSGNCCGYALKNGVDDSGFLGALIQRYVKEGRVDPKRVFVTGMSNGAMMAHRLACEHAELVAAIAPVAGAVGIPECRPHRPVSVLMIHGQADQHVPYEGGEGRSAVAPRVDRSAAANASVWRAADGCPNEEVDDATDGVRDERWSSCGAGTEVRLLTHPGGHVWPGGKPGLRNGNADPVVPYPKATETIWAFFAEHGRR